MSTTMVDETTCRMSTRKIQEVRRVWEQLSSQRMGLAVNDNRIATGAGFCTSNGATCAKFCRTRQKCCKIDAIPLWIDYYGAPFAALICSYFVTDHLAD